MIRDALGNRLHEGSLVLWKEHNMIYKVVRIVDPNDSRIKVVGAEPPMPAIALMATIPLTVEKGKDFVMSDFFCLIDPAQQDALERLTTGTKQ